MSDKDWEILNTEKLLRIRQDQHEQTISGGAGGYEVPLGQPIRSPIPPYEPVSKSKKKKKGE